MDIIDLNCIYNKIVVHIGFICTVLSVFTVSRSSTIIHRKYTTPLFHALLSLNTSLINIQRTGISPRHGSVFIYLMTQKMLNGITVRYESVRLHLNHFI